MLEDAKQWVTEHPYLTGGIVISGVLAFFAVRSLSSVSSDGGVTVYQDPGQDPALVAAQLQAQSQLSLASIAAGAERYAADRAVELGIAQLDTAEILGLAGLDVERDVSLAEINAGNTQAMYDRDLQIAAINAQLEASRISANATVDTNRDYNETIRYIVDANNQPAPEPTPTYRDATTAERVQALLEQRPDIAGHFNANPQVREGTWQGWDNDPTTVFQYNTKEDFALAWVAAGHGSLPNLPRVRTN